MNQSWRGGSKMGFWGIDGVFAMSYEKRREHR